jgi:tetratricopeptide (TPR) repeat protein
MKAKLGPDHPNTLTAMFNLALVHQSARRLREALPLLEEVSRLMKAKLGPDHPNTLIATGALALTYRDLDRPGDAIPLYEGILELKKAKLGPDDRDTLNSMNNLIGTYLEARRWAEAEAMARECLEARTRKQPDDWLRFYTTSQLGAALAGRAKHAEAEPFLIGGYEGLKARAAQIPAPFRRLLADAAAQIVPFYEAWGKPDKAAEWRKTLGPTGPKP